MALTGLVFLPFQQQRQRCAGVSPHVARHLAPNVEAKPDAKAEGRSGSA
jgi:hypothetical protein